jgi:hypothetical protein
MIEEAFETKKEKVLFPPSLFEPLMSHRFIVEFPGLDIKEFLFQSYKLYTEGENFIFEAKMIDAIVHQINPVELLEICKVNIHHLDPTGQKCGGYSFRIKGLYYESGCDYANDELLTHKIKGVIEEKTFHLMYKKNK